jgi:uncharacterized protein (TIGR00290 family)
MKKKAVFNWSGGKDSALALQYVLADSHYDVVALLTTLDEDNLKSTIHAIPIELLQKQADSIGIPLYTVPFAKDLSNYEAKMKETITYFKQLDVHDFIFGDIHLHDIKSYRKAKLNPHGIHVIEPLWGKTSTDVMHDFLQSGIIASIIVTKADCLDQSFIGKPLNAEVVSLFPSDMDVCGENGEYHTFAHDGPLFTSPVTFAIQDVNQQTYHIKLDTGEVQTHAYWQAVIL